jgi:hypothetical protein
MPERLYELAGSRVFECAADGSPLKSTADALDLINMARSHQSNLLVIPASRLHDDFFRLRSGVAGEFIRKFVTYGLELAILGDVSCHINASAAFRDFVYESNKGTHPLFVTDADEGTAKLNRRHDRGPNRSE